MKHYHLIFLILSSFLFSQDINTDINKKVSKLIFDIDEQVLNHLKEQRNHVQKNKKFSKKIARENFQKLVSLENELNQYHNYDNLSLLNKDGDFIRKITKNDLISFSFSFKNHIIQDSFIGINFDWESPSDDDFQFRNSYIEYIRSFIIDDLVDESNNSILYQKDMWVSDSHIKKLADINSKDPSTFFIMNDFISQYIFEKSIMRKAKMSSISLSPHFMVIDALEKLTTAVTIYADEDFPNFINSDYQYYNDIQGIVYNMRYLFLKGFNLENYPNPNKTGKDICLPCSINAYISGFDELLENEQDSWYVWTEMRYFDSLIDLNIFSQSGDQFIMSANLNDLIDELEYLSNHIPWIIENRYKNDLTNQIDLNIKENGYPEISNEESIAESIDEFKDELNLTILSLFLNSTSTFMRGGYKKESIEAIQSSVLYINSFSKEFLQKLSKNNPYKFEELYNDINMFKLLYAMANLVDVGKNQLAFGNSSTFINTDKANELIENYYNFQNDVFYDFNDIVSKHDFEDKSLKGEAKVIDNIVDYLLELVTDDSAIIDLEKEYKKLSRITRPYGKENSEFFTLSLITGLLDSGKILINEDRIVKHLENELIKNPTVDNLDTYVNYSWTKQFTDILYEDFNLTDKTTSSEISDIISSDKFNENSEKYSEIIFDSMYKIFNENDIFLNAIEEVFDLLQVRDIQTRPEYYSQSINLLKTIILLAKNNDKEDEEYFNTLLYQIVSINKLNTILEYDTAKNDPYISFNDYLSTSDEELENIKNILFETVVNLGIPIVQPIFLEEFGVLQTLNGTFVIEESQDGEDLTIEKLLTVHDTTSSFMQDLNTNIALMNKNFSKNMDSSNIQRELYNNLINPIFEQFPSLDKKDKHLNTMIFITDATTHAIPFDSLLDENNEFMLNSHLIIRSNSILKLVNTDEKTLWKKDKPLLITGEIEYENNQFSNRRVANYGELKNLKWSKAEMQKINNTFLNSKISSNLTETAFKNLNLNDFSGIHFSVHGISIFEDFNKSALFLSSDKENDGVLTIEELKNIDFSSIDFVFLSACETNVGKRYSNLYPVTLQSVFHQSGVNSTISTLWSIEDEATSYFSEYFYKLYNETDFRFLALHRAKQLFIKENPQYKNPYYWSAFTLDGF